jgi:hypothetical protein
MQPKHADCDVRHDSPFRVARELRFCDNTYVSKSAKRRVKSPAREQQASGADVSKAFARFLYVQRRYGKRAALAQYPQFKF